MPAKKFRLFGFFLLVAVSGSQALTLGRLRGVALVGQPLDVVVQVQMEADESPASLCFEADVFHADTRQEPSRVQVSVEPAQSGQPVSLRVRSAGLVDEPVVTVYLRAGCTQKSSRRYVLLADVATEQNLPAAQFAARVAPVPLVAPVSSAAAAPGADAATATSATAIASGGRAPASASRSPIAAVRKPKAAVRPKAAARAAVPKPSAPKPASSQAAAAAPAQAAEKLQAGRSAGQSRLKLDPLEVLSERVATLESSTASAPVDVAALEARAAQRIEALETSVKNLLVLAAKNESSLADMKTRVQQAESERYLNPLVYGLAALLLASLAALVFLLPRGGRFVGASRGNWWSGTNSVLPVGGLPETGPGTPRPSGFSAMSAPGGLAARDAQSEQTEQMQRAGPRSMPGPITQVDVSLVEMSESTFDRLMQSGTTHNAVRKKPRTSEAGEPAATGQRKSIHSEELFDIRQQAEFFVSLGQTDQAVTILENRISESGESSPLAYLDLLKIFHSLGLRADFRQVREDFSLLFNARIPEFASFADEGRSLESYPEVLAGITRTWATPEVFATLEASLFRDQWNTQRELFDLAAFRDLLLLHAIAQGAAAVQEAASLPAALTADYRPQAGPVTISALSPSAAVQPLYGGAVQGEAPLPTLHGVPELDIDLSDLHIPQADARPPALAQEKGGAKRLPGSNNLIDFDMPGKPVQRGFKGA